MPGSSETSDPFQQRAVADAIVQRAADGLRELLVALARRSDPFPPFPGALFAYGIEVEPPAASDLGCVILGDDGALYELQLGLDADQIAAGGDAVAARYEQLVKLDLPPADYIAYAHRAVDAATDYLERQPPHAASAG